MISTPLVLLLLLVSSPHRTGGEVAEECSESELVFSCPEDGQELAIREAWLYGSTARIMVDQGQGDKCYVPEYMVSYKQGTILQYINKQCGGQKECRFNVTAHVPNAIEKKELWEDGVLRVTYDCLRKTDIVRVCDSEVSAQSGWLQTVGYPQYYLGGNGPCTITIKVDEGQQIQLTLTDLSIRDIVQPNEDECRDSISVTEGRKELLKMCGEIKQPITVTSEGPVLSLNFNAVTDVFPKRGYAAYYEALGCESPPIPEDGYRSFRNATHAEYWCCVHHVFPDTLERRRILKCNRGSSWNDTVPDCIELQELLEVGNITEKEFTGLINGSTNGAHAEMYQEAHIVYDLVVPTVIMSILVIGNVAVVVLIIYCRRDVMDESSRSEELESIKANPEPTDTLDSTPCSV
ncbi:uncharacterized protein [Penaeus vannamei]|uniref:uncharacterized protein n=1 Tax=Penaeus vannamei TaxID=6689 RepID=UPI000F6645B8|nr:uncharacterized protein LOC113819520 [Penaeus vannamei]